MKSSKKKRSPFKTRPRYRLTFVNENRLTQVWSIKMSRSRVIVSLAVIVLAVTCMGAMLISFTPLRTLLPGYLKKTERREYIEATERIDSIINIMNVNDRYLNNLNTILKGEIDVDSLMSAPIEPVPLDTALLIGPSRAELDFVSAYSAHEGFSLDNATTVRADAPAFVSPIRDVVVRRSSDPTAPIYEVTDSKPEIFAIAKATVVDVYESAEHGGITVTLQHPDGYLSRYQGLSTAYHKPGDTVASGQKIGRYLRGSGPKFQFSLMRDGVALNPTEYIQF